jgi:hypothetical protein
MDSKFAIDALVVFNALRGIMQTWYVPCAFISSFACERGFFFL